MNSSQSSVFYSCDNILDAPAEVVHEMPSPIKYQKPINPTKKKTNRQIIKSAIKHTVFPGVLHICAMKRLIKKMETHREFQSFLLLIKDGIKSNYCGLYGLNCEDNTALKLDGPRSSPKQISNAMVEASFRYNTGAKSFAKLRDRCLSVTIDAAAIKMTKKS